MFTGFRTFKSIDDLKIPHGGVLKVGDRCAFEVKTSRNRDMGKLQSAIILYIYCVLRNALKFCTEKTEKTHTVNLVENGDGHFGNLNQKGSACQTR